MFRLPSRSPRRARRHIQDNDAAPSQPHRPSSSPRPLPGQSVITLRSRRPVRGDLIIGGAIGRTDLPGCSVEDMQKSIQRVMQLPDETRLFGGTGQRRRRHERKTNPYVQMALEGGLPGCSLSLLASPLADALGWALTGSRPSPASLRCRRRFVSRAMCSATRPRVA